MRYDSYNDLHRWAQHERAKAIAGFFAESWTIVAQLVSKAWRSNASSGTKSSALS